VSHHNSLTLSARVFAHLLTSNIYTREPRRPFLSVHCIVASAPPWHAPARLSRRGTLHCARPAAILSLHHAPAPPATVLSLHRAPMLLPAAPSFLSTGHPPAAAFSTAPSAFSTGAAFSIGATRHSTASSSASTSLHSLKQQGDVRLKTHVTSVYFKCFRCFRGILQVFYTDVAKVDCDVAYVAMVVHLCCKYLFPMFHLFFRRML
jgi:hypothetical protein